MANPADHPALRVIGIAADSGDADPYDVAREHDRYLADLEDARTAPLAPGAPRRRRAR
jgi:hypothetical protein